MKKEIPTWIVRLIGHLFRFVVGAFGVSPPHPMKTGLCAPFWTSLVGVTVGLPIVLAAYGIKLVVKNKKARKVTWTILWVAYLALIAFGIVAFIIILIGKYGFWKLLISAGIFIGAIIVVVLIIFLIRLLIGLVQNTQWYSIRCAMKRERELHKREARWFSEAKGEAKHKKPSPARLFFGRIGRGIWGVAHTIGLVIYATYKQFCPRVEFP